MTTSQHDGKIVSILATELARLRKAESCNALMLAENLVYIQNIDHLQQRCDWLLAALKDYGQHHPQCGSGGAYKDGDCDCGLSNVLAKAGGET